MRTNTLYPWFISLLLSVLFISCENTSKQGKEYDLSIFFISDHHSQTDNFSKIKVIIDEARQQGDIMLVSSGDMFSGNPLVDYYPEKGYPVIDLMNHTGFDLATLGNHEFDYGQEVLQDRIDQAEFEIICANMESSSPLLQTPPPFTSISAGDLEVCFVGVIETGGKPTDVIPSTHPGMLENLSFSDASDILGSYSDLKDEQDADLLILLSHLGHNSGEDGTSDYSVARDFPFFDAIIGGHSHSIQDTTINGVHIYQSGAYLDYLGKASFRIKDGKIISEEFELIDLNEFEKTDEEMEALIEDYNNNPAFYEVIGTNAVSLTRNRTAGCYYTDALRGYLDADMAIQNPGGIRAGLDEGDISILEIYRIDPFNNMLLEYEMEVSEIKSFLKGSGAAFYYSGVIIETGPSGAVVIKDPAGTVYSDDHILSLAINDYIPAVYEEYFGEPSHTFDMTTADAIISYTRGLEEPLSYDSCKRYFRYSE